MDMITSQKVHLTNSKDLSLHKPEENRRPEVNDIHVSHFTIGQKEALRAVLKQRTQNTFVNKEVKVQLLEDVARERPDNTILEKGHPQSVFDSAAAVAAMTAASIASSAPLFRAQNKLETKINSVSGLLNKLEERDKYLQHIAEQQTNTQVPGVEKSYYRNRIIELEKQLTHLTEQRLQHLEKLQQQQLYIQSHFLSSAVSARSYQALGGPGAYTTKQDQPQILPSNSTTTSVYPRDFFDVSAPATHACITHSEVSSGKSPLETPAPRRFAPIPMTKDGRVSQKEKLAAGKENMNESRRTANLGKGIFLEQILRSQETPMSHRAEKAPACKKNCLHSSEPAATFEEPLHGMKPMGSSSISSVQKAHDVFHDLGQLKKEVHSMLQEAKQWRPQSKEPVRLPTLGDADHISKPSLLQTTKASKSMFEDAERILRDVQNSKKVLEENLEAINHAKDGAAMYSLISVLSTNSDAAEEIRIQKTVDAWITAVSMEIQDELARMDFEKKNSVQKDHVCSVTRKAQKKGIKINEERKDHQPPRKTGQVARKPFTRDTSRETTARWLSVRRDNQFQPGQKKVGRSKVPHPTPERALTSEEFLSQVYGKAIYQGHRRTLKKGPYLRVNSPSPKSKLQRPKVIEHVKGVKVKSARTQTGSFSQQMMGSSPPRSYPLSAPFEQDPHYLFSPNKSSMSGLLEGHLIPMAIPLGRSRFDGAAPQPAAVLLTRPQPITVTTSIPPSAPKPQPTVNKPNVAVIEMKSEKKDPPKLTVQVLPNVDIDSVVSESASLNERSQSPVNSPPPPPSTETVIQTPESVQPEEEYAEFPGTNLIDVTDIAQDQEKEDEIPEPVLELNGWSEPGSAQYSGLPFPPILPAPQLTTDILDGIITKRETLENRLINWVEQEIMVQIINRMYPIQPETLPTADISESEESAASDIVEAAGGGGLQLFVSAGVPVNSDLIRQYVNEALAETITILLSERGVQKGAPAPRVPESVPNVQATIIHTPVVTPQPTPIHSPPPLEEPVLVKTPLLSPQSSEAEFDGSQQSSPVIGFKIPEVTSPIVTPTPSIVASPPRVDTPSPHAFEHISEKNKMLSPKHVNPWGDTELPLEEENPNSDNEKTPFPRAIVMSVAKEEEAESLISRSSPEPERSLVSVLPGPRTPSPVPVPSPSSSSSEESTSSTYTVTETDTADRPISEGEVLYSFGQMVVARAVAEEGLAFDQIRDSLSSTLQDTHEMEYDPPSEGQVVKRPHKGYHRDPVLSLMAQLDQAPFAAQEVVCNPESSEDDKSVGELSDGQRPRLTTAAESILVGHSIYMREPSPAELRSIHMTSPGQFNTHPGIDLRDSAASRGPMSIGELEFQPVTAQQPTQINAFRSKPPAVEDPSKRHQMAIPEPTRSLQVGMEAEILQQAGVPAEPNIRSLPVPGKMTVTLPSVSTEKHAGNIGSICDDTDSSGADTF
uniref:Protein TALPID3 isoform X2 n=1 Tax=Geotrypetes seraphini TaxID=260995 RepID=A0A6P8RNQ4_GEOSA|nr:protein TALPID3 isoform X2 [Geotrypetes seraphini]